MPKGLIDVHHHFWPAALSNFEKEHDLKLGYELPQENFPWSPEVSISFMNQSGIDTTILSFPALSTGKVSEENRALARQNNVEMAKACKENPGRFGFFAHMPYLFDTEGVLAEIAYALDELKADGVAISSSYGAGLEAKYVGNKVFEPIWAELNSREAVVFLHGTQTPSSNTHPDPTLGIPMVQVPNETFKAASSLVVTSTKRKFPDVKIILSHMGGSMPFLSPRIAAGAYYMGCSLTPEEIIADFKSFYFDTALSAHETTLITMESFITPDRLLFGSDFPAASKDMISWYTENMKDFYAQKPNQYENVAYRNALKIFPRLETTGK
ncbi:hypothetical protein BDP27DRAFT_697140 [Rhodocollybia butyracea]|uniref:Amidohydrolase-related domain-containing protein n=1 Tax=Rhodocollybia butyracea TaxID=206335 RepID=A0A9P5Q763_9AGAR|nr:hypothetical protein BDP27DRAFT_697140 [Rhodocollybia butyracea]